MSKLIGFVGYPRTGKDAVANYLVEHHGFKRVAFGDAVKRLLLAIDPCYNNNLGVLERRKANETYETREKLQKLGQVLRNFNEDFWVQTVRDNIMESDPDTPIVVTDIRYPNEYHMVKDMGGEVVAIERPGYGPVNGHQSETNTTSLLDHADRTLTNDKDIAALVKSLLDGQAE